MNTTATITKLFYEEHLRPTDIASKLKVAKSYITKVIQKDDRYFKEKENRISKSKEKHKASKRNYINQKRQEEKQEYQTMLKQINSDNAFLSTKSKTSDIEYAKWNRGMYEYDKNSSDLVLRKDITTGYNVCKRVSNIVNPNCIKQKSYV